MPTGERVQHQIASRSAKDALQHVGSELLFGGLCGQTGFINVRTLIFIAAYQTFGGHDLEEFKNTGIAYGFFLAESQVNLADGRGTAVPKDTEDLEFGRGWLVGFHHAGHHTTKLFVLSTKIFVLLMTPVVEEG